MEEHLKKKSGITLIALIVTIIILLILAGISLSRLIGDNGVLTKSVKASERTNEASAREKLELILGDASVEKNIIKKCNNIRII